MFFSPQLIVANKVGPIQLLSHKRGWGQKVHIVPRSECSFRLVLLGEGGDRAQKAALFKVKKESLPDKNTFKLVRNKAADRLAVWGFNKGLGVPGRYLPETLAREPFDHGARLVRGLEGFEGQFWLEGELISSRWWSDLPIQAQWNEFLYSIDIDIQTVASDLPNVADVPFRQNLPRFEMGRERLMEIFSPVRLGGFAALFFTCILSFYATKYLRSAMSYNQLKVLISETSQDAETVLGQQRRAIGNLKVVQKYRAIENSDVIMQMLNELIVTLKGEDLTLERFELDGDVVDFVLAGSVNGELSELVLSLEESNLFEGVNIRPQGRSKIIVSAEIKS